MTGWIAHSCRMESTLGSGCNGVVVVVVGGIRSSFVVVVVVITNHSKRIHILLFESFSCVLDDE